MCVVTVRMQYAGFMFRQLSSKIAAFPPQSVMLGTLISGPNPKRCHNFQCATVDPDDKLQAFWNLYNYCLLKNPKRKDTNIIIPILPLIRKNYTLFCFCFFLGGRVLKQFVDKASGR